MASLMRSLTSGKEEFVYKITGKGAIGLVLYCLCDFLHRVGITPIVQGAVEIVENGTQNIVSNLRQ